MLKYAILGLSVLCLLNLAAHAAVISRGPDIAAIVYRWLPTAVVAGTAAALALGGLAFLLSLAAA